jgi:serine/threonine-protein kinase
MEDNQRPPVDLRQSLVETSPGHLVPITAATGISPSFHSVLDREREFPVKDWDRYEFIRFLGEGGMGKVFLARDRQLHREVAIKFVRIENGRINLRFMIEARAQARVDHEHVCRVFEVGEVEGKVFIAMQHIAGKSLDQAALELSLEQKVMAIRDAAKGVHEAHRVGIIHRDLKPSNIMVEQGEDGALRTFVMDFGLAKEWNQDITETGSVLGTPSFMSPEQARGEVSKLDRRSDIYSLGASLYQVITGRPPVTGSNALEILSAIGNADVPAMRALSMDIPKDLEAITLKCLEKDRSKRYDSAKAFAEDLDRFLAGEPVLARPTGLWYRVQRKLRKHKQLTAIGATALVIVLITTGVAIKTRREAGRRERLTQRFTESVARIESMARYSALAPLHDIRPDLKAVRAQMDQLRMDMNEAGSLARGPGNYALGRGYLTLDDQEKAREHLQMAWDAGYRESRASYALAVVMGRQYQEKLLEAERISSKDQREARLKELEATLRAPTLAYLRQVKGSDAPSPGYLQALMALYEGRPDESLERLKKLEDDQPWFYEAPLLRGSIHQARAWKRWNQGDRDGALSDFEAGRRDLTAAATSGRSVPAVYAARANLELNVLFMEKYGQGHVEPPFDQGMAAVSTALAAQADHVPSHILEAALRGELAGFKTDHGQNANAQVEQSVAAARKAVEAGSSRADARIALGKAYFQWGNAKTDANQNPTEQLSRGLQAFESLSVEKRDYTVWNHLGLIHQTWSDFETQRGRDPSAHLNGAIAAYEQATQMEPHLLPAWINLGTCLQQRAALPRTPNPEGDLQAALKVLEQAHTLNPKHFVPYFVQGRVLLDLSVRKRDHGGDPGPDLQRSIEACRQGIAINPGVPHLHTGMGMALFNLARVAWESGKDPAALLAQAQAAYVQAIKVAPKQVYGHANLGDLMLWKARWSQGAGVEQALREAEAASNKALQVSPGNLLPLGNQGRAYAMRIELTLRVGEDPNRLLVEGEATLAKALAQDPLARDSLQYLGELRSATARWKALHGRAGQQDFELAAKAFRNSLEVAPEHQDTLLALAHLELDRAEWERAKGLDARPSLIESRKALDRILKVRPRWGEALALQGGLELAEAEGLPSEARGPKAKEALWNFQEAFSINSHLVREWKPMADRAQRWGKGFS